MRRPWNAFRDLSQSEASSPPSKARIAVAERTRPPPDRRPRGYNKAVMIVNISGRGDKDMATAGKWFAT